MVTHQLLHLEIATNYNYKALCYLHVHTAATQQEPGSNMLCQQQFAVLHLGLYGAQAG